MTTFRLINIGTVVSNNQALDTAEVVMLVAGSFLFVILAVGLIVLLAKDRKIQSLLPFFFVAIVMIGFPFIRHLELKPGGVTIDTENVALENDIRAFQQNPQNQAARIRLEGSINRLEILARDNSNNDKAAINLARGNLLLGNTEKAVKWADQAVQTQPDLPDAKKVLEDAQEQQRQKTRAGAP